MDSFGRILTNSSHSLDVIRISQRMGLKDTSGRSGGAYRKANHSIGLLPQVQRIGEQKKSHRNNPGLRTSKEVRTTTMTKRLTEVGQARDSREVISRSPPMTTIPHLKMTKTSKNSHPLSYL